MPFFNTKHHFLGQWYFCKTYIPQWIFYTCSLYILLHVMKKNVEHKRLGYFIWTQIWTQLLIYKFMETKSSMALKQEFKEMNMYIKSSWVQNAETISDNAQNYKYVYIPWMSIVNTIPGLKNRCFWEKCASITCALYKL